MTIQHSKFGMPDSGDESTIDEDYLKFQLSKYSDETIIDNLLNCKQFLPRALDLHIEELHRRGHSSDRINSILDKVETNEGVKSANSTLSLTRRERMLYLFAPWFLIDDMLKDFEKDGCDTKLAELDSLIFARYFTSKAWLLVVSVLIGIALMIVDVTL